MSKPKFTQGPWSLTDDPIIPRVVGASGEHDNICAVYRRAVSEGPTEPAKPDVEALANAHLIAAAPEMYDAISNIIEAIKAGDDHGHDTKHLEHLLAKARGES